MFNDFDFELKSQNKIGVANIKVIGVGGGGCNAVSRMYHDNLPGVEFIVANTDAQQLNIAGAHKKIVLGEKLTKGLGAGSSPEIGKKAAMESEDKIKAHLEGANLVFIATGLGGGTGTGAAPVVAKIAKDLGALVIGIVTTPFSFEGRERVDNSKAGLSDLIKYVDSYILISNERLLLELGGQPVIDSFKFSDSILKQAVRTITELIILPSMINLDFADIKKTIEGRGPALIGIGHAKKGNSDNLAIEAAVAAITSPILESSIEGAKFALVNITGGKSLTLDDANDAVDAIKEAAQSEIDIIFGVQINENINDDVIVSVIATGLKDSTKVGLNAAYGFGSSANSYSNSQPQVVRTQKQKESFIETLEFFEKPTSQFGSRTQNNQGRSPLDLSVETDRNLAHDDDDIPSFMRGKKR